RSTASAALRSTSPRAAPDSRDQVGKAPAAARTASLTSSASERGNSPIVSDGRQGPCFSYVAPERLGRHSPPTKFANAGRTGASRTSVIASALLRPQV